MGDHLLAPDDHTLVTVVECINPIDVVLPPMLVIKGKILMARYLEGLPDDDLLTTSDASYINARMIE
jgi:hypothetical protein